MRLLDGPKLLHFASKQIRFNLLLQLAIKNRLTDPANLESAFEFGQHRLRDYQTRARVIPRSQTKRVVHGVYQGLPHDPKALAATWRPLRRFYLLPVEGFLRSGPAVRLIMLEQHFRNESRLAQSRLKQRHQDGRWQVRLTNLFLRRPNGSSISNPAQLSH